MSELIKAKTGMTVAQLIEDLKTLPLDTYVWMPGCEACGGHQAAVASYFEPAHVEERFTRGPSSLRGRFELEYPHKFVLMDEDRFREHMENLVWRLGLERPDKAYS
jgi:hypothetical protein